MNQENNLASQIVSRIYLATQAASAELHEPCLHGNELKYIKDCVDTNFVSSVGAYVDLFEKNLATYVGAEHAIAVVNGTSALHIALMVSGVQSQDEVLLPALTFIATANAISYCGATPHFVDSEEQTLGIDFDALTSYLEINTISKNGLCINKKSGKTIRAIVPMHVFGHPVNVDKLLDLAEKFNLIIVEDAAEALGSFYKGIHVGLFGRTGVLSFNGNKIITTGGGGAILTNDSFLAKKIKHMTTTAKVWHDFEYHHDMIGFNYRLPNLNAALGCAQLEQMPDFLKRKKMLYELYKKSFSDMPELKIFEQPKDCNSNYWLQTLILPEYLSFEKDLIISTARAAGYMCRPVWGLLNEQLPYVNCPSMNLVGAKNLSKRLISMPSAVSLVKKHE